ncbi:hypothetical protein KIH74_14435 [Kineosporia sp. J2-2]|uniref:Uncharacterized protein n=1 Tax=Kineosporia corallincola TaxID=2835133 RepID=A0ABS5TGC4_9ACTN|nr:hypothetical protein [Kineosporia corallincola]MBT0770134.1 hypothetical protein [Kineosporia corallincola]
MTASLEERVTVVEERTDRLEERVALEAGLAASRDRDLADLTVTVKSHTAMLQAVQERQAEHTALLNDHTALLNEHTRQLDEIREGQQMIVGMLTTLIDREPSDPDVR